MTIGSMTPRLMLAGVALIVALALPPGARAQGPGAGPVAPPSASMAAEAFTRALALAADRSPGAQGAFESAARRYAALADAEPSPRLRYNEGTAWLRAGDTGRAILAYRRAGRLGGAPDDRLAGNLALARARVRTGVAPPSAGLASAIPPAWLAWLGAVLFSVGWALAGGRVLGVRVPWALAIAAWGLGIGSAALFVAADAHRNDPSQAVVIAEEVTARLGPDAKAYEPSFTAPLTSGVEVRIAAERAGWALIRLGDGREAWVPADTIERV